MGKCELEATLKPKLLQGHLHPGVLLKSSDWRLEATLAVGEFVGGCAVRQRGCSRNHCAVSEGMSESPVVVEEWRLVSDPKG